MVRDYDALPPTPTPTPTDSSAEPMIWVTGCNGMLGRDMVTELSSMQIPFIGTDTDVDIADPEAVSGIMNVHSIQWIVNCAAYTAVDRAEAEEEQAFRANGEGPGVLAKAADLSGARLIHISTDYVFDGEKSTPYNELDIPCPVSVYGKSKQAGEQAVLETTDRAIILRVSWLYGLHGRNFVETMVDLFHERDVVSVVDDQIGSPTWTVPLARSIVKCTLFRQGDCPGGIYHYQDGGSVSWYGFACGILETARRCGVVHRPVELKPVTSDAFPTAAPRPRNSQLETRKIRNELGFPVVGWRQNLNRYFEQRGRGVS